MFFAKSRTRSQNLNYNSLYSTGIWHAINDTYKKVALIGKEKKVWNFTSQQLNITCQQIKILTSGRIYMIPVYRPLIRLLSQINFMIVNQNVYTAIIKGDNNVSITKNVLYLFVLILYVQAI
jgi:hypothetical protein